MTEKLEEKLKGICPSCKNEASFNYIGMQDMLDEPKQPAYNCSSCRTTILLESYIRVNKKSTASSQ